MSEPTNQENEVKSDAERIQSQKDEWDALGEEAQQEIIDKHEKLESEDAEEEESAALIQEHLIQHNENKKNPAYLVRGAELMCSQGSNKRMMNLSPCHGVYIKMHAVVHELDCIQGDEDNITWFGVCTPGEGLETESIKLLADNGTKCHGKKCEPHIIGTWMETHEGTKIVDNGDKLPSEEENAKGCNTLTMDSFLVCKYGGIIMPITSGQDREVTPKEFAYDTEEEKKAAFDRVSAGCSENIDGEEGCDDLLYAKLGENESEFENEELDEENSDSESSARDYTQDIVDFVKKKEGFSSTAYNNGKTIAYGFDMYLYPDIEIIYNPDGTVSEKEGERLLRLILDQSKEQINIYLDETNQILDQSAYDALLDLYYNRNSNSLTKEVVDAMAERDDEKVWELLEDFDYRYAYKYLYKGDEEKSKAYVERNPGLKERRKEEYSIYLNGF